MNQQQLLHAANFLHQRIRTARGVVAVYYDASGVFRISPTTGRRYNEVAQSFPNSIVGIYKASVPFNDFFEDFDFFCGTMGLQAHAHGGL
jgi:hypothetical protein